jgi:hypothetical protein
MTHIREILLVSIAVVVLVLFGLGIGAAAYYTLKENPTGMPGIVSYFVGAVNGTLAANLGAVLGISTAIRGWRRPETKTEKMQWIAACWYVGMLAFAGVAWGLVHFSEEKDKVVSVLPDLTKTGIGICIAVLAAVLGVQSLSGVRERQAA